jgi:lipopolysaccharide/colanic/teichoic acid biosynthesis glycosyltransferase
VGLDGREFEIFKIRSMKHDCERISGAIWSQKGDTRVTPVGRVLRRLHIDELPQLINVLRREMSLIGPRPERPVYVAKLEQKVPLYRERLQVRPGVTGLAQVQLPPDSDEADVWRKQAYDLYYIANMSPWMDVRILLATGLKLFCVPYSLLAKVFSMPKEEEIYHFYWDASTDSSDSDTEDEVAQMQTV